MEEPYGMYGLVNPTGHTAIYFQRVCADTPLKLRRCRPGELGAVVSRYEGIGSYDWIAMPLIPYLYSVGNAALVPEHADRATVTELRDSYRESHLDNPDQLGHSIDRGRWTMLVGAAYERRIYAFRFDTTEQQDDALIAWLNGSPNRSHFHMLSRNCADFARTVLGMYFPRNFHRNIFPDAGITTPKLIANKLVRYARKHAEIHLTVIEIPQIPGYHGHSHSTKDIAESFSTSPYAVPLTLVSPYLFGSIAADYLVRGRYRLVPRNPEVVAPDHLTALTSPVDGEQNAVNAVTQAAGVAPRPLPISGGAQSGLQKMKATNE